MPIGALQRAKRAFVGVLRSLTTAYDVTVDISRTGWRTQKGKAGLCS